MVLNPLTTFAREVSTTATQQIDFYGLILPLLIYTIAIALYAIFVQFFYKSVSNRDLFQRSFHETFGGKISYILKYFIAFPVLSFTWFGVLTILLFFLSKTQTTAQILLISVAVVSAVRVAAYYSESVSTDVAKILPFAILGIFLTDPTFFSLDLVAQRVTQIPRLVVDLFNYLIFIIALEFVLRTFFTIHRFFSPQKEKDKKDEEEEE